MTIARLFQYGLLTSILVVASGCDGGGPSSPSDGGAGDADAGDADADPSTCSSDDDCDDGLFCNGPEHCVPGSAEADARGCVPAVQPPCLAGQSCSDEEDRCVSDCAATGDADRDGHLSTDCGGADCDDADPNRFPGNAEVCDRDDHDEDCDPSTFGVRDGDGDGEPDAECCNVDSAGTEHCGTDCDDTRSGVSPLAPEVCDGFDNDCDCPGDTNGDGEVCGAGDEGVDEGVLEEYWVDADGDDHGDETSTEPRLACFEPEGYSALHDDCDDGDTGINPGVGEVCDEGDVDENCDGVANPDDFCTCSAPAEQDCPLSGACEAGVQVCNPSTGEWGPCSITPVDEICNYIDDDCDGSVDEGTRIVCYMDADEDGYAPAGAEVVDVCADPDRPESGGCPEDTTDSAPFGTEVDCDDDDASRSPGRSERCVEGAGDDVDEDCDGLVDEGVSVDCYLDIDNDTYAAPGTPSSQECPAADRGWVGGCPVGFTNRAPSLGADCADTDSAINPAATEICDPEAVDENCDGEGNPPEDCDCAEGDDRPCDQLGICAAGQQICTPAGDWGPCSISAEPEACNGLDDDCNGLVDDGAAFECAQGSSPISCTTSCGTSGTADCLASCLYDDCLAAEECNGCDDDGDVLIDEDFDCAQGSTGVACTTRCGTDGFGPCRDTCDGVDRADCFASLEVCNYCDDDGNDGTLDEEGLAVAESHFPPECDILDLRHASCSSDGDTDEVHLTYPGSVGDIGAAWIQPEQGVGWGEMVFRIHVKVENPRAASEGLAGHGWAVVLTPDPSGFWIGNSGDELAVPYRRTAGLAIEWRFYTDNPEVDQPDSITVRRLTGSGSGEVLATTQVPDALHNHLDWVSEDSTDQYLRIHYWPDNPSTPDGFEERLYVYGSVSAAYPFLRLSDDHALGDYAGGAADFPGTLDRDLPSGSPLDIGVTAANFIRRSGVTWMAGHAGTTYSNFDFYEVCPSL